MLFHSQALHSLRTDLLQIFAPIAHMHHPPRKPVLKILYAPSLLVVLREKRVIPSVISLYRRRMRSARLMHHRFNQKSRHQRAIGV